MPVKFVKKHSFTRAILKYINAHIVVSTLILVMCVIRPSDIGAV
jgi:hypothetical protein